jgi:hypothetical protein
MRVFRGLVAQLLLAPAVAFLIFPLVMLDSHGLTVRGHFVTEPIEAALGVAFYVGVFALFMTVFVVFPATVWLLKRRYVTAPLCLAIGLGLANLPVVVATLSGGATSGLLRLHAFASLIGASCAAAFWVVAIRGRDFSRDQSPSESTVGAR